MLLHQRFTPGLAIASYIVGDEKTGEAAVIDPTRDIATLAVHELKQKLDRKEKLAVLDVRTETEWNSGHIAGAVHIHGGKIQEHFGEVPRDRPVAVVFGSGYRASIAASFLQRTGYEDVANVSGGMSAWEVAKLPTTN